MSKEIWDFKGENGSVAYMAGVIDVLSDRLCMLCDFGYAFEADIIAVDRMKSNDFSERLKKRLKKYHSMQITEYEEENISKLNFLLKKYHNQNVEQAIYEKFQKVSKSKVLEKEIREFCDSILWYIGKPATVYEMDGEFNQNSNILEEYYLGIITDMLFVEYDDYMVMMFWGSVE